MFIGLVAANGRNLQNRKVLWDRPQDSTTDIKGTNRWQWGLFSRPCWPIFKSRVWCHKGERQRANNWRENCSQGREVSPTKGSCPVNPDQFRMALIGGQNNSIRQKWGQRPEFIIPKPTRLVYNFQPTKGHDDSKANSAQLKSKNNLTSPDLLSMQSGSLSPRRHLTQIAHINTTTFMRLFN